MTQLYSKKALLEAVEITRGGLEAVRQHSGENSMVSLLRQAAEASKNPELVKQLDDMLDERHESLRIMVIAAETFALNNGCTQEELDAIVPDQDIITRAREKTEAQL